MVHFVANCFTFGDSAISHARFVDVFDGVIGKLAIGLFTIGLLLVTCLH
jgi:hypothetical protein